MIRSRPFKESSIRELLAEARWGLARTNAPPRIEPRAFCMVMDGRLHRGTDTLHRTPEARRWRTMLRLRARR